MVIVLEEKQLEMKLQNNIVKLEILDVWKFL